MIDIRKWAEKYMVTEVPANMPVWHWSHAASLANIKQIIKDGEYFHQFHRGATGHGLYVSTSAIDLMDRGNHVLYAEVKKGTKTLLVDPRFFSTGVMEIFERNIRLQGWPDFKYRRMNHNLRKTLSSDPPRIIDFILQELALPCCLFSYGLFLAFMIRKSTCLEYNESIDPVETVVQYHMANPQEVPMLAPDRLHEWFREQGIL